MRSRETNLGRLAADATLWYPRQQYPALSIDIALKNGGGLRSPILGPNITRLAVGTALAFDNKLAVVELTGAELLAVMENAVSTLRRWMAASHRWRACTSNTMPPKKGSPIS